MFKLLLSAAIVFSLSPGLLSQDTDIDQRLKSLNFVNSFPEKLLTEKTVVFVQVPDKSLSPRMRGDWQHLADKAQPGFKKCGIDAVAYYYKDDIFSGQESYHAFLDQFDKRDLKNVVFIEKESDHFKVIVTDLQDRKHLLKEGQEAWKKEGTNFEIIIDDLYRSVANSGLVRTNRLILDVPEFGDMVTPIKGRRNEFYDLNFSSDKLAVPVFADTAQINRVMASYPYKYVLVPSEPDESELRKQGIQYVLYYVHSAGKSVKQMLGYTTNSSETVYISEIVENKKPRIESYNVHTPVYKFYIKRIYSKDVFVGKKWDASSSWQTSLSNYIANLKNELEQ